MTPPRESVVTRVETFSDAMLAFAATLLVLGLDTPRDYGELIGNVYGFFPLALTFAVLFLVWLVHTTLFRRYPLSDKPSIVLNGALLFIVLLFVYPLKFLAAAGASLVSDRSAITAGATDDLQRLFVLFALGWILVFSLFALLYQRAWQTREALALTPVEAYDATTFSRHYAGFVAAGFLSLAIAWLGIGITWGLPVIVLASVFLFTSWNARTRRKGRDDLATTIAEHPQLAYTGAIRTSEVQQLIK